MLVNPSPATAGDYFLAALERLMRRTGQGGHYGATVLRLKCLPDVAALQQSLNQIYEAHALLGARLHREFQGWQLVWKPQGPLRAPAVIVHETPTKLAEAVIQSRLVRPLSPAPVSIEVFQDPAVLITWRHGIIDGIGLNLLIEQLATGDIAVAEGLPAAKAVEAMGTMWSKAKPGFEALRKITCDGSRSAWQRGVPMDGKPAFRVIELNDESSARAFARIRHYCGDFFQMPFYAALAVRALRWLHRERETASACCHLEVPYQQGKRGRGALFQNRMGMLLLPVREAEFDDLDAAVAEVTNVYRDSLRRGLPQAMEALMRLTMHVPVDLFMPFIRFQNEGEICSLFHSHTGTFLKGIDRFAGAEVQNVFNVPGVSTPPGLGVFFSDFAGRITATLAWREGCISEQEEHALVQQLQHDLTGS